jgi:hypothetical protein
LPRVQTVQLPGPQSRATRGTATAIQYVHKAMALGACAPKGTFVYWEGRAYRAKRMGGRWEREKMETRQRIKMDQDGIP